MPPMPPPPHTISPPIGSPPRPVVSPLDRRSIPELGEAEIKRSAVYTNCRDLAVAATINHGVALIAFSRVMKLLAAQGLGSIVVPVKAEMDKLVADPPKWLVTQSEDIVTDHLRVMDDASRVADGRASQLGPEAFVDIAERLRRGLEPPSPPSAMEMTLLRVRPKRHLVPGDGGNAKRSRVAPVDKDNPPLTPTGQIRE
jgi:hypothetical protein